MPPPFPGCVCCAKAYTDCCAALAALHWLSGKLRGTPGHPPSPPPSPPSPPFFPSISPNPKFCPPFPSFFFPIFYFLIIQQPLLNPEPYTSSRIATNRSLAPTLRSRAPFSDTSCIENNFWPRATIFNHSSFHDPHIDTNDQPHPVQSRRHTLNPTGARVRASERGERETERDKKPYSIFLHLQSRTAYFPPSRTILNYRSESTHLHANCDKTRTSACYTARTTNLAT